MTREDAVTKGRRYAAEGRLVVTRVDGGRVEAVARGDGRSYRCGFEPDRRGWWCECMARGRCCHLVALGLVVVVDDHRHEPTTRSSTT